MVNHRIYLCQRSGFRGLPGKGVLALAKVEPIPNQFLDFLT